MAIPPTAKPTLFLGVTDRAAAQAFYSDRLGLPFLGEHHGLLMYALQGVTLYLSVIHTFTPHEFTVLNWEVPDLAAAQAALKATGVVFTDYREAAFGLEQDENLVWTAPDGTRIAWFNDPAGNVLSISQPT